MDDKILEDVKILEKKSANMLDEMLNGSENFSFDDAYKMADVTKDMAETKKLCYEAEYYKSVVEAMEDSKKEDELMAKMGMSKDEIAEQRFYRNQPRNARGQYKEDGRPNRYYNPTVMPEVYSMDMYDKMPQAMRSGRGIQYYGGGDNESYNRGYSDGERYGYNRGYADGNNGNSNMTTTSSLDRAMRNYEEYRRNHNENTSQENANKSKEAEKMMREIDAKLKEYKQGNMSPEEKTMIKTWLDKMLKEW